MVGDLLDASGAAVAGGPKYAISVNFDSATFYNNHPAHICFLQEGNAGTYVGSMESQSTSAGKFVIFKMRKSATFNLGNGAGPFNNANYQSNVVRTI